MPVTDSTRMAMPWPWSNLAALLLAATACTATSKFYVPSEGESRLNQHTVREQADQLLALECPRLLEGRIPPTGEARIKLDVARSGAVQRAEVTRGSGDERLDEIFGSLAARLQFDPLPAEAGDGTTARMRFGYSCGPGTAVTTISMGV